MASLPEIGRRASGRPGGLGGARCRYFLWTLLKQHWLHGTTETIEASDWIRVAAIDGPRLGAICLLCAGKTRRSDRGAPIFPGAGALSDPPRSGRCSFSSVQSMPFARPRIDDIVGAIDYVIKNDYLPRARSSTCQRWRPRCDKDIVSRHRVYLLRPGVHGRFCSRGELSCLTATSSLGRSAFWSSRPDGLPARASPQMPSRAFSSRLTVRGSCDRLSQHYLLGLGVHCRKPIARRLDGAIAWAMGPTERGASST